MKTKINHFYIFLLLFAFSCQQVPENNITNTIIIREKNDAATLNPFATNDRFSIYAGMQIFQTLINIDYKTEKVTGIVATAPPQVSYDNSGKMIIRYAVKEGAQFGNNEKLSFEDILFSLKVNFCPLVANSNQSNYYGFIEKVTATGENEFTISCSNSSILNEMRSGDFFIYPRKHYDSLNLLQNFSLDRLRIAGELEKNDSIIKFAEQFNESITSLNPSAFVGSGPYQLKKWQKGERIILEKKKNWWGNRYKAENTFFIANANELQFEIINDNQTAINALKAGEIDVLNSVKQNDFEKIQDNTNIKSQICDQHGYSYVGFNCNHPILKEVKFRKALEAAFPYQKIIEVVYQNQGILNRLPLALKQDQLRNEALVFEGQNLEKAKALLAQNEWKDSNNNGTLDKVIDGILTECELQYHYNTGNDQRKAIGYLLKNEFEKIGIKLQVNELEWVSYLKTLRNNEVQLFMSGKVTLPLPPDLTGMLHSSEANGGGNFANYKNVKMDSLLEQILIESDAALRTPMIKKVQEIVAEDAPYIFLLSTKNRFAYSKRLKNVPIYSIRPHYWAAELY